MGNLKTLITAVFDTWLSIHAVDFFGIFDNIFYMENPPEATCGAITSGCVCDMNGGGTCVMAILWSPLRGSQYCSFTKVGKHCVAGCSITHHSGVSGFHFPKHHLTCKWADEVSRTRDCWVYPTHNSLLCSHQFGAHCFDEFL